MSEKSRKAILLAISTMLRGGMEREKIKLYIHATYSMNFEEVEHLLALALYRL